MNARFLDRAVSLALAVAVTLGMLVGVDHLAAREQASTQWAAALTCPRG